MGSPSPSLLWSPSHGARIPTTTPWCSVTLEQLSPENSNQIPWSHWGLLESSKRQKREWTAWGWEACELPTYLSQKGVGGSMAAAPQKSESQTKGDPGARSGCWSLNTGSLRESAPPRRAWVLSLANGCHVASTSGSLGLLSLIWNTRSNHINPKALILPRVNIYM